jgi:L-ascorbate metabolism protein UlaG (beta-lactamase superfamily)
MTWRRGLRFLLGAALLLGIAVAALLVASYYESDRLRAFGARADASTRKRLQASPQYQRDHFENRERTSVMVRSQWGALQHWLFGPEQRAPSCPLPLAAAVRAHLDRPSRSGLRVTWLGHSTTLIEIDGATILTDPQWSERASPLPFIGPRRFHPPPLALADLPHLDAVVISHEHYDHLDMHSVRALARRGVMFHVPLGMRAHLILWGVAAAQITEHDWWQGALLPGGVQVISTPARHFNGRGWPGHLGAEWTSWSLIGPLHRVFFSGDTGPTEELREIGRREGPFDLALIEIGQWDPSWGDIHLGPRGALDAQVMLRAQRLLPIHWATFQLAFHAWSEPAETLVREAAKRKLAVATPLLGEPIEPTLEETGSTWWRLLPPMAAKCPK